MTTSTTSTQHVAIYARVSSDQQAQEQTIASQVAALRERITHDGHTLDEELCFIDDGVSGSTLMRPAMERLRDIAYVGGFQKLYVHSPDRLARRYAYQVLLVDELTKHGIEIEFLNRSIGVSPEEDLLLQMQGMFAEYERAKIMERSRRGKRHGAGRGRVNVLSGAPYGYRYISKRDGGGEASYEINEEQASIVRQIFEWVGRDRISIGEVSRRLKQQGVLSARGKSWWDRTSVWAMLKNPAYMGSAAFGKTRTGPRRPQLRTLRGQSKLPRRTCSTYDTQPSEQITISVPAIISAELFAAVQEQLTENKLRGRERKRGARYLLQGLVECHCCGYAYYGKSVSRSSAKGKVPYAYYRCVGTDAYRFGGKRVCDNKQVRTDKLDQAVWNDACELLRNPKLLRTEYERRLSAPENSGTEQSVTKQIASAQRTVNRLIDAYADGVVANEAHYGRYEMFINRRSFLFVSSGAAAGSFAASGLVESAENEKPDFSNSGLVTGNLKPLKHKEISGFLSAAQIAPHHTAHYGGALKTFVTIDAKFEENFQKGTAIDPQAFEAMQRTKSSRGNSVVLHEMYFDGLALKANDPATDIRRAIEKRFGSLEKWANDFIASAKTAAGWAMLVHHPVNGRLYNVVSDEHAMGPLWLAVPLVVIDVYEHAFYIDYQNRKADYVEKFMNFIDWNEANQRYRTASRT